VSRLDLDRLVEAWHQLVGVDDGFPGRRSRQLGGLGHRVWHEPDPEIDLVAELPIEVCRNVLGPRLEVDPKGWLTVGVAPRVGVALKGTRIEISEPGQLYLQAVPCGHGHDGTHGRRSHLRFGLQPSGPVCHRHPDLRPYGDRRRCSTAVPRLRGTAVGGSGGLPQRDGAACCAPSVWSPSPFGGRLAQMGGEVPRPPLRGAMDFRVVSLSLRRLAGPSGGKDYLVPVRTSLSKGVERCCVVFLTQTDQDRIETTTARRCGKAFLATRPSTTDPRRRRMQRSVQGRARGRGVSTSNLGRSFDGG